MPLTALLVGFVIQGEGSIFSKPAADRSIREFERDGESDTRHVWERPLMSSYKTYVRMIGFMRPYLGLFILSAIVSLVIVSMDGISIWFLGTLPKALFNPETAPHIAPAFSFHAINEYLKYWTYRVITLHQGLPPLAMVCLLIVITFTLKNAAGYLNSILLLLLNLKIVQDMRNQFYRHVLMLPVSYYDRNKSGEVAALVVNDVSQVNTSLTSTFSSLLIEPFRLLFFVGLLCIINVKLTLMVFIMYPVFIVLIVRIGRAVRRRSKRWLESFSGMISILTETVGGIRAVKMFNMNTIESEKFEKENHAFTTKFFRSEQIRSFLSPMTECLAIYVTATLLWYGGKEALAGSGSFGAEDFFRFLFILFSSYQPIKKLGGVNSSIQSGIAAADRVFNLMNSPVEPLQPLRPEAVPAFNSQITFDRVGFKYPGCQDQVLNDISFAVKKGQIVAIVGSSGAGKSTILDLLPRFYEIESGVITLDGKNVRDCDLVGLRHLFGIVAQETILFDDTVANNIAYGTQGCSVQQIEDAARAANALEFIERMPLGMQTVIGERGVMLSGGQRQRLSIARALLKNPPILILDEATSALDTESERYVQNAINTLMKNRTALVVAHRLSTIQNADFILVVEAGRIIERGTHAELLALNKRYKYLHDMQFNPLGK
jgi:subfamily B ATP-binding cassette protein MsbA